jgi:hypothetical protein
MSAIQKQLQVIAKITTLVLESQQKLEEAMKEGRGDNFIDSVVTILRVRRMILAKEEAKLEKLIGPQQGQ